MADIDLELKLKEIEIYLNEKTLQKLVNEPKNQNSENFWEFVGEIKGIKFYKRRARSKKQMMRRPRP